MHARDNNEEHDHDDDIIAHWRGTSELYKNAYVLSVYVAYVCGICDVCDICGVRDVYVRGVCGVFDVCSPHLHEMKRSGPRDRFVSR